jgi:hypothetical protein
MSERTDTRRQRRVQLIGLPLLLVAIAVPFITYGWLEDPGHRYYAIGGGNALDWDGYAGWYLNAGREAAAASLVCFALAAMLQLWARRRPWGVAGWSLLVGVVIDVMCLLPTRPYNRGYVVPIVGRPFEEVQRWVIGIATLAAIPLLAIAAVLTLASVVVVAMSNLGVVSWRRERSAALITWAAVCGLSLIPLAVVVFFLRADFDPS